MLTNAIKIISDPKITKDDNLDDNLPMPSSGGGDEQIVCKPTKRGLCVVHGVRMTKMMR